MGRFRSALYLDAMLFVTHAVKYEDKILRVTTGARCYIIGTVYKEMKLKPNILDEYHAREV